MPFHFMTYLDGGPPVEVRDYFVEPDALTWDGASPLGVEVADLVAAARAYAAETSRGRLRLDVLELATDTRGRRRYYYFKARFAVGGRNARSVEVFLDLRGAVIRPDVKRFASDKEYNRYAKGRGLPANTPRSW